MLSGFLRTAPDYFASELDVPEDVAKNEALLENVFCLSVCILNRIPVFLVGKPGSSKTLTMQILQSNFLGEESPSSFWRQFPSVHVVQYQCSPLSDAASIEYQFNQAKQFQVRQRRVSCFCG